MDIEQRLARLEEASRKLQAQQIASKFISQTMYMLMPVPSDTVKQLMTKVYDVLNEKMKSANFDEEFQKIVRAEVDAISADIVMAFDRKSLNQATQTSKQQ